MVISVVDIAAWILNFANREATWYIYIPTLLKTIKYRSDKMVIFDDAATFVYICSKLGKLFNELLLAEMNKDSRLYLVFYIPEMWI